ncbi:TPA: HAMP domain-containing histidine kinase [Burkholderia cenocepacia]|uniref:sensor histidine kinase n=1 Tax=unclassified Burkholderia TaxID=2613784 RepID=UPI00158C8E45|nr:MULTISPECIES: HAMP domain-containing sensor histidine kinase [unclassified Burkholderia]HEF5875080.1 HAMP domain-containing histidine kinase [Burkholderia cenocepacia]
MNHSLRGRLASALCMLVAVFAIVQGLSSYQLSKAGMSALLDLRLEQVANRMHGDLADLLPASATRASQPERDVVVTIWKDRQSTPYRSTEPTLRLPRDAADEFASVTIDRERWRVYTLHDRDRVIQVAQRSAVRAELAEQNAVKTLWPMFVLIPLVCVLVLIVINWSLGPLDGLGEEVQRIDVSRLQTLSVAHVPVEIRPFIDSINRMIERLAKSIDAERKFISDAAHELRTPLTALQIQATNLARDIVPDNQQRFRELQSGIARGACVVEQLLGLARAETAVCAAAVTRVDVTSVVVNAIADVLPIATSRNIDIGADDLLSVHVNAVASDVSIAVRNLVCNAIRYTPDGGKVDLCVRRAGDVAWIDVIDTGPGIPEHLLSRVFDRFFRANTEIEGTGLGLSIVQAVAARYGGVAILRNRDDGPSGLVASISFPAHA